MKPAHEKAINWALAQGFNMSVTDLYCDPDQWDCKHSTDRAEILDCINGTDVPNVYIFRGRDYLMTFSVIDEGIPDETINDYTMPRDDAEQWRKDAFAQFEDATYG